MRLREYQERCVHFLARTRRGILQVPAGGGKTLIGAAAIAKVLSSKIRDKRPVIGWMANTVEQCQQATAALARFPIHDHAEVHVGCAAGTLPTATMDLLVVDECHHAAAPQWAEKIERCPGARWGLSATPFGPDVERTAILKELFSEIFFSVGREELLHHGHLTEAEVRFVDVVDAALGEKIELAAQEACEVRLRRWPRLRLNSQEALSHCRWHASVDMGIVWNKARNDLAIEAGRGLLAEGRAVLVLVNTVEHGELLGRLLGGEVCHSRIGRQRRREMITSFKEGNLRCLVATSLADEGLDVPRADGLVLVNAGRSSAKIEQRTGRVLRPFSEKECGVIVDFDDQTHPMLYRQSQARRSIYQSLGYAITKYHPGTVIDAAPPTSPNTQPSPAHE